MIKSKGIIWVRHVADRRERENAFKIWWENIIGCHVKHVYVYI
jgi:hypothetical protein